VIKEILKLRADLLRSMDLKDTELEILSLFTDNNSNSSFSFKDVQLLTGLNNQSLTESLAVLVASKGFLERSRDTNDRRVVRYQLNQNFLEQFLRIQRETSLLMIDAIKVIVEK
jgi:DNA-binding MarR family transcriptional regulator